VANRDPRWARTFGEWFAVIDGLNLPMLRA
jgi:hypothetical protein